MIIYTRGAYLSQQINTRGAYLFYSGGSLSGDASIIARATVSVVSQFEINEGKKNPAEAGFKLAVVLGVRLLPPIHPATAQCKFH